jgi:Protein of unknown function (DUF2442)
MLNNEITAELQTVIDKSREVGEKLVTTEPRAVRSWFDGVDKIFIELKSGIVMGFPYHCLQGLESATTEQLSEVETTPSGYGLHWESLDVDLAVPQLVTGIFGGKAWMAELGRQGGKSTSLAKAQAARDNGKRGGRPRKNLSSPESKVPDLRDLCKIADTEEVAQARKKKQVSEKLKVQD